MTFDLYSDSPYVGYAYAYPHKTAYRPLTPPAPLSELWAAEKKDALFLYVHIPFCGRRCHYCNLFAFAQPPEELVAAYLATLARQARQVRAALGQAAFARMAIGGGTPTYLNSKALDALFDICADTLGADARRLPVSVETSPATANLERLAVLQARGVSRISIGVQSFAASEMAALGRDQTRPQVETALQNIRQQRFPTLNIDLIYGIPGQTVASWLDSIRAALQYAPEELYLYPLYIRPLTAIWRQMPTGRDNRLDLYRAARQLLLAAGYQQVSMRMFRAPHAPQQAGPAYCCQEDGMIGLGCGPRSYTRTVHYASEYAISARATAQILNTYLARPDSAFQAADYGFCLTLAEQQRRYVIKSLLQAAGLVLASYAGYFGSQVLEDLPQLAELIVHTLAVQENGVLRLTAAGLERSDVIGPWLYSAHVLNRMQSFQPQ